MTSLIGYTTLDVANYYFSKRLRSTDWENASDEDKVKAIAQAEYLLSGCFYFYDNAQVNGVWDIRVIVAVCEEALFLLKVDPTETPSALYLGISQANAGSASASFDKTFVAPLVCTAAKGLIGDLGALTDLESTNRMRMSEMAL